MMTDAEYAQEAYEQARQDEIGYADHEHDAFMAYMDNEYHNPSRDDWHDGYSRFQDAYAGEWESFCAFADDLADDIYSEAIRAFGNGNYFDYDAFARDLQYDYYWTASADGGGVYVFRND